MVKITSSSIDLELKTAVVEFTMPYEVELDNTLTLAGNQVFKAWPMYGIYSSESSTKSSSL